MSAKFRAADDEIKKRLCESVTNLRYDDFSEQHCENIVLRIGVSAMLTKSLGEGYLFFGNLCRSFCQRSVPAAHTLNVFIHSVMRPQPFALALVTGQHLDFLLD